ncbi:MAG: M81 family metallopeptidase, partial [Alphaproteobacteria bacterium]|nr:M81 family metallopeptidase [Alphaproteobacteria bacterium]
MSPPASRARHGGSGRRRSRPRRHGRSGCPRSPGRGTRPPPAGRSRACASPPPRSGRMFAPRARRGKDARGTGSASRRANRRWRALGRGTGRGASSRRPGRDARMIRIATAGFQHESNTFSTVPASLERWRASGILEGEAIRAEYESS